MDSWDAMNRALETSCQSPNLNRFLIALASEVRRENGIEVWPGINRLAQRLNVSRSTVIRLKKTAKAAGLIDYARRSRGEGNGTGRSSDLIRLLFLQGRTAMPPRSSDTQGRNPGPQGRNLNGSRSHSHATRTRSTEPEEQNQKNRVATKLPPEPEEDFFGQVGDSDDGTPPPLTSPNSKRELRSSPYEPSPNPQCRDVEIRLATLEEEEEIERLLGVDLEGASF